MANSVFARPYIESILATFEPTEHRFLVVEGPSSSVRALPDHPQVEDGTDRFAALSTTPALMAHLVQQTRAADQIVLHSMFLPRVVAFLALQPSRARRTSWVIWGADIHGYLGDPRPELTHRAYALLRRRAVKRFALLVPLVPGDIEAVEQVYAVSKPWRLGLYANAVGADLLIPRSQAASSPSPVRVLVGNAASSSNRHEGVLRLLARFADEDMEVLVPLGYGDGAYAERIRVLGRSLLGDRFHSLDAMLPPERYAELLNTIDVAVFNHERQEGLGTYYALAYVGAKIYAYMGNDSARFLADGMQLPLFDIQELAAIPFSEFARLETETMNQAQRAGRTFYDLAEFRRRWDQVFRFAPSA